MVLFDALVSCRLALSNQAAHRRGKSGVVNLPSTTKLVIEECNKRISCRGNHMTRMDTHRTRSLLNVAYPPINILAASY